MVACSSQEPRCGKKFYCGPFLEFLLEGCWGQKLVVKAVGKPSRFSTAYP